MAPQKLRRHWLWFVQEIPSHLCISFSVLLQYLQVKLPLTRQIESGQSASVLHVPDYYNEIGSLILRRSNEQYETYKRKDSARKNIIVSFILIIYIIYKFILC